MGDEDADTGKDSGNESAEADSDSEDKKESIKAIQNALVGMNVSSRIWSFKHFNQTVFLMRDFGLHRAWIILRQISSGQIYLLIYRWSVEGQHTRRTWSSLNNRLIAPIVSLTMWRKCAKDEILKIETSWRSMWRPWSLRRCSRYIYDHNIVPLHRHSSMWLALQVSPSNFISSMWWWMTVAVNYNGFDQDWWLLLPSALVVINGISRFIEILKFQIRIFCGIPPRNFWIKYLKIFLSWSTNLQTHCPLELFHLKFNLSAVCFHLSLSKFPSLLSLAKIFPQIFLSWMNAGPLDRENFTNHLNTAEDPFSRSH